ncbi:MAG: HDOD domain-containing protein [Opitutales bacterium]|nr:HDOD domain-containing protein [Opitutales bacterium]NRA26015.1 HDOD domain-containing protein [Opitutales bacterium]
MSGSEENTSISQESLAEHTIETIRGSLSGRDSMGLNGIIRLVQDLSSRALSLSVDELSNMIGSDPKVASKVISAANTLSYNPFGVSIKSVTQAIHLLGFDQISNLTLSLLLMSKADSKRNPMEQREISAKTLVSAYMAKELALEIGMDPFQSLACTALRSFAKLLMSSFMIDAYREANAEAKYMSEDAAYSKVFGLTPLQLGHNLLLSDQLPKTVKRCLDEAPDVITRELAKDPDNQLLALSETAIRIVQISEDEDLGPEELNMRVQKMITRLPGGESISEAHIKLLFSRTYGRISEFEKENKFDFSQSASIEAWKARSRQRVPNAKVRPQEEKRSNAAVIEKEELSRNSVMLTQSPFPGITSPLSRALTIQPPDIHSAYKALIDYFYTVKQIEEVLIFLPDEEDAYSWYAQWGRGVLFRGVGNRPIVKAQQRDLIGLAIQSGRDVFIPHADTVKIQSLIPKWMHIPFRVKSLGIWPMSLDEDIQALLVMAHIGDGFMSLEMTDMKIIQALRKEIEFAYRSI